MTTNRPKATASGPEALPELRLAPASRVPLRDQIAVQITGHLRAGHRAPGDPLPSVRALARSLGLHRDTVRAAYRRLAGEGMVTIRPGAGVYVAAPPDGGFRGFVAREREAGRSFADTARLVERWRSAVASRRVTVVGPDRELRELWAAELRPALAAVDVALAQLSVSAARDEPRRLGRSVVAAPPAVLRDLAPRLPRWTESMALAPGPSARVRRLLLRLPRGAVVGLATRADAVASQVSELAASLRDGDVAMVAARPDRGDRLDRALRVARFVLADVRCRPALRARVERGRLLTLRHLPAEAGRELARSFGPAPRGGADGGASPGQPA